MVITIVMEAVMSSTTVTPSFTDPDQRQWVVEVNIAGFRILQRREAPAPARHQSPDRPAAPVAAAPLRSRLMTPGLTKSGPAPTDPAAVEAPQRRAVAKRTRGSTRTAMLVSAAELLREHGAAGVTVDAVLARSAVAHAALCTTTFPRAAARYSAKHCSSPAPRSPRPSSSSPAGTGRRC